MNVLGCQAPDVRDWKLFSFVTTESNAVVEPIHNKAMPVLLATAADVECWSEGTRAEALALQKAMPDDVVELMPEEKEAA
jgi:putative SOS response-associated peptidase YedK